MSLKWIGVALLFGLVTACDAESPPPGADGPTALDSAPLPDAPAVDSARDAGVDTADDTAQPDVYTGPQLLAGAASVDITPVTSAGVPLAGYGGSPRRKFDLVTIPANLAAALGNCYDPTPGTVASLFEPAQGKHDPIMARAVVLSNGTTKAAIVKVDFVGVSRQFRDDLEQAAKTLGIPGENLIVAGTHTHSGPGAAADHKLLQIIAADCFHAPTYKAMADGAIKALTQADAALHPAKIGIDSVQEKNASENRTGKPGHFDPELGLIKVVDSKSGQPIAAVLNFAVHGTCLGASNMLFSADLMGYAEQALETKLGGGVALFLNGAEGDVKPSQGGFSGAAAVGGILADAAAKLWPTMQTKPWIEIAGAFEDVTMPNATYPGCIPLLEGDKTLCDYLPSIQLPIDLWMQKVLPFVALRLDDVVLATVPGEPTTDIGLAIKQAGSQKGFRLSFVVGLANDYGGYVTTKAEYIKAEYEGQSTLYGENTGTIVVTAASDQIDKVKPASP